MVKKKYLNKHHIYKKKKNYFQQNNIKDGSYKTIFISLERNNETSIMPINLLIAQ